MIGFFFHLSAASGSEMDIQSGNFTVSQKDLLMFFFLITYLFSFWFQEIICGQLAVLVFLLAHDSCPFVFLPSFGLKSS